MRGLHAIYLFNRGMRPGSKMVFVAQGRQRVGQNAAAHRCCQAGACPHSPSLSKRRGTVIIAASWRLPGQWF